MTEALLIFVIPPSLETLFARLRTRATETADELELRQANAAIELARQEDYDHVVVDETGEVETTAARIEEIIADEHRHTRGAGSGSRGGLEARSRDCGRRSDPDGTGRVCRGRDRRGGRRWHADVHVRGAGRGSWTSKRARP